jgi:hypothetical protein
LKSLKENLGSVNVALSAQKEKEIGKAVDEADVNDEGYPESFTKTCYANLPSMEKEERVQFQV